MTNGMRLVKIVFTATALFIFTIGFHDAARANPAGRSAASATSLVKLKKSKLLAGIETVTVTAQKQLQNLQSVPLTDTAFTAGSLHRWHIKALNDLTGSIPNVQIHVNAGVSLASAITIRGIGVNNQPSPFAGTEVATVIDGVVQATDQYGLMDLFDVERIEVLAGPQGTLFGANTTGGVVNIVYNQPTGTYGAYGQVTYGNYNQTNVGVALNFPIVKNILAGKIAFTHDGRDGFYTNLYNNRSVGSKNENTLRMYLKWTPSTKFNATLESQFQIIRNGDTLLQEISYPGEIFYRPNKPGFTVYDNIPNLNRYNTESQTLTMHWDSPIGKVISISNYSSYNSQSALDFADVHCYCFDNFGRDHGNQYSEEIRDIFHPIASTEVLVGLFGQEWTDYSDALALEPFVNPDLSGREITSMRTSNLSAFTQAYWNATRRLQFQAGIRIGWDQVHLYRANYNYMTPGGTSAILGFQGNLRNAVLQPLDPTNLPSAGQHSWIDTAYKIGARYKFTSRIMAYGYYARGYKAGGFNGRVSRSQDIGPFNPEFVDTYESGLKSEWLNHRLRMNFSAFLNNWSQMQVPQTVFANGGATLASVILNAGQATTEGFELRAAAEPVTGFLLTGSVGYLSAYFNKFLSGVGPVCPAAPAVQPANCVTDYAGRTLPFAPMWTASIGATYSKEIANGVGSASVEYTYTSRKWGNYTYASTERLPPVGLVNASVSWGPDNSRWSLQVWVRNLTDNTYLAAALDVPPLFTESVMGNPRQFGMTLKFKV